jgi:hypothetical protein
MDRGVPVPQVLEGVMVSTYTPGIVQFTVAVLPLLVNAPPPDKSQVYVTPGTLATL